MEALMLEFAGEVAALKRAVQLRGEGSVLSHCEGPALLEELDTALVHIEERVTAFAAFCDEEEAALEEGAALLSRAEEQGARLTYDLENLPDRLPAAKGRTSAPAPAPALRLANSAATARKPRAAKSAPATTKSKRGAVPAIPYVRAEEFAAVPKYIRGRLTQNDVNSVVDGLHEALTAKYKILATPRAKLSDLNLKHWTRFKEQETTATDNTFFLTDDDLRQLTTACKPDRSTKTALTILRSLNRVKEVRDGGLLRYALA